MSRPAWPAVTIFISLCNSTGVQIDPKEWWDAHWIKDYVAKRVDLSGFSVRLATRYRPAPQGFS